MKFVAAGSPVGDAYPLFLVVSAWSCKVHTISCLQSDCTFRNLNPVEKCTLHDRLSQDQHCFTCSHSLQRRAT
jgi:hypothetical protein